MMLSPKIKNRWGYFVAFMLLLLSYFLIFFIINKLARQANSVSHSYDVINKLESIKGDITDAETGMRGYIIYKDVQYLKPYNTGSKRVMSLLEELKTLTNDNKTYKADLDSLGALLAKRLADISDMITKFQREGFVLTDEILVYSPVRKKVMDNIRTIIERLKEEEQVLMDKRNKRLEGFFITTTIIAVISLLIALVTVFYSLIKYNRENKARDEADTNVRIYSMELEQRVKELDKANTELEELRSLEKFAATGRIARTIAHEVRNPLTNISLASEQLKEIAGKNEESQLLLDMVGRNVNRINHLVSDLLNSTKFLQLEYTPADINQLIDEALVLAMDRIELNHIKIEKQYEKNLCEILVDKEKIKIAFLNIIVNAIEAMEKDKGVLKIKTLKQGNRCIVEFSDNGSGMDEETIQRLFEPYFTGKPKGSGLGLTNTQNIILTHKGNIQVRSKPGRGSTFFITLNLSEAVKS